MLGPQLVERFRSASSSEECTIALQKFVEALLEYDPNDMAIELLSLVKSARELGELLLNIYFLQGLIIDYSICEACKTL